MSNQIRILIVEDSEDDEKLLLRELHRGGYEVTSKRVETASAMTDALDREEWDFIISDYSLPQFSGLKALEVVKEKGLDIPFILVSGTIGEEVAVEAMRAGAQDYVMKNNLSRLCLAIERELQDANARRQQRETEQRLKASEKRYRILFNSTEDAIFVHEITPDGMLGSFLEVNDVACRRLGYTREEILQLSVEDIFDFEAAKTLPAIMQQLLTEKHVLFEMIHLTKEGKKFPVEINSHLFNLGGSETVISMSRDITERKRTQRELELRNLVLELANHSHTIGPLLKAVIGEIQDVTGCSAVGIRLQNSLGQMPFEHQIGFTSDFDQDGDCFSSETGALPCSKLFCNEFGYSNPNYTRNGSFFANNLTLLLQTDLNENEKTPCSVCGQAGFESIATIPIRVGDQVLGIVHLADDREDMVPLPVVELIEKVALNIGTAVQRIRAEIALSEGEEQYRSLVEQLNDMVFTTDEQGTFTFVSPAVELIAGFAPSEVVGKNFSDFIIETDLPRAANDFKAVLAGEAVVAEYRISNKSGEIRWTRSTSRPLFKGNILTGMQGIVTDITDQKLAEVALRESEEKYRTLVEQIPDVIFTFDAQGLVTFVSSAIISLTGYAPSDLLGQSLYSQLLFEDDLPKAQESYSDFSKGKSNTGEYRIITASEDLRWVRLEATPVFKDGIFTGGQGIATDITSSRQAEEALRESEREYRRLVDLAQEGILAIDPNGKISFVNPRMAEMLGYATDEMLGKQLIDFMAPEMVTIAEQQLDRGARGEAEQLEFKFLRKDGGKVDALLETAPRFDEYGEYIGALSCVINITERKRLEEELQEKEQKYREHLEELVEQRTVELKNTVEQLAVEVSERKTIEIELRKAKKISEAANKAKSDFLANMSHELRTPLNSIIGFSQILQDGIPGVVNDEQQEVLGNILDSAKLLLALINDILDLSKIEAGRITLNFQEFSLQHFLKRCLELFTERANTQNIQLSLDIADDLTIIIADEIRLKQIIFNLLSNALKFTPTGGEVGIIALNTDTRIEFTVWDTGIGIAQENLPKLFQAFQQLETPYSREHQGTGLGLYYSKKLVELHGGEIWVESLEGTGSRFTFTIPTNLQITDSPPK